MSYPETRDLVMKGNLQIFRNELVHVLYKKFVKLIHQLILGAKKKLEIEEQQERQRGEEEERKEEGGQRFNFKIYVSEVPKYYPDFNKEEFPLYKKELAYLDYTLKSFIGVSSDVISHVVAKDEVLRQIFSDSSHL